MNEPKRTFDSFHGEVGAVVFALVPDALVETQAQWVPCIWRSHSTKTAILESKLRMGLLKQSNLSFICPSAQFALFVPCDRQLKELIPLLACQIPSFHLALHRFIVRIYHKSEHIVLSGTF